MTIEDAIKILNREKVATISERNEAIDMAIKALEFVTKLDILYRELGYTGVFSTLKESENG